MTGVSTFFSPNTFVPAKKNGKIFPYLLRMVKSFVKSYEKCLPRKMSTN